MNVFFRAMKISFMAACLFITSFMNISVQKNSQVQSTDLPLNTTSISINFNEAIADGIDCGNLGKDACKAVKKQYRECKDNAGSDQEKKSQCKTDAYLDVANAEDAQETIDESMADFENMTSVSGTSIKQVFILLLVEFISAVLSAWTIAADPRPSAIIHALMGVLMFGWLLLEMHNSNKAINQELQKFCNQQGLKNNEQCKSGGIEGANKLLQQSQYAGKLTIQKTDNEDAGLAQTAVIDLQYAIIEQEKEYMNGVKTITLTSAGMMAAAAVAALLEALIFSFKPNISHKLYYSHVRSSSLLHVFNSLFPNAQAQEEDTEYTSKNQGGNGLSILTTSVGAIARGILGAAAGPEAIAKIVTWAIADKGGKIIPWVKILLFAISSANFFYINHRIKQNIQGYQDRLTALNELKAKVNVAFGGSEATFESGQAGTEYQDARGLENVEGDSKDYTSEGCVDGKLESFEVTVDADCQTPKQATLSIPSVQVGDMKGIETNGLSTDPMEYAKAIVEKSNGKGTASLKKTGAMNAAIGKKVLRNLLNKIKNDSASFGATKGEVTREIEKAKTQRRAMIDKIANALPKSSFAAVTKAIKEEDTDKEVTKKSSGNVKVNFDLPEFNDPKMDMDEDIVGQTEEDSINSADALSKVQFDQNDIVKKPEVSIWKILNLRYKKSGWKRVFKRKKK